MLTPQPLDCPMEMGQPRYLKDEIAARTETDQWD